MPLKEFYVKYETDYISIPKDEQLFIINETLNSYIANGIKNDTFFLLGFTNLIQGNLELALKAFEIIDEQYSFYYLGMGLIEIKVAQRKHDVIICQKAIDDIITSIQLYKSNFNEEFLIGKYHLGQAYSLHGLINNPYCSESFENAKDIFNSLVKKNFHLAYCYNELGNIYIKLHKINNVSLNDALDNYYKALKEKKEFSRPYNGIGNIYRLQKQWKPAIFNYEEALKYEPDFYYPKNYLGDCYRILEDYDEAISCYKAAIKINPEIAYAWSGLGRVFYELGNRKMDATYYDRAKKYFKKALKINENFGYALHDYAKVLEKKGDIKSAVDKYEKYELLIPEINIEGKKYIKNKLRKLEETDLFKNELSNDQGEDIVKKIIAETCKIEDETNQIKETFTHSFFNVPDRVYDPEVFLEILRKWNSYTPIVRGNSKGGGYFIKAYGKGIVIDPGFNFIENFISAGHKFSEIDLILISHAHDDHTADLESIISLLLRYNKHLVEIIIPRELAKEKNTAAVHESEKNRNIVHERWKKERKHVDIYLSEGAKTKYKGLFRFDKYNCADKIERMEETNPDTCKNSYKVNTIKVNEVFYKHSRFTIKSIFAQHEDLNSSSDCLGFILDFQELDTIIVYTGDTGWCDMEEKYRKIKNQFDGKKILLLAHLGGFKIKERNYFFTGKDFFYENHLGRIGLTCLNNILEPDLCIISEYGEEFVHSRLEIAEIFNQVFDDFYKTKKIDKATKFLPADIGLTVDLTNNLSIKAIEEVNFSSNTYRTSFQNFYDIKTSNSSLNNQLFYYHKNLEERNCIIAKDNFMEVN